MADDIDEQVRTHIREILRLVRVKNKTLQNLNELVRKISLASIYHRCTR